MRRVAIPSTARGNGGGAESASPRLVRCKGWASLPKQNHTWHVSTSAREAETSSSGAPAHCATFKHCIAAATSVRWRGGIPSAHPPVHATHTPFHSHSGGVTARGSAATAAAMGDMATHTRDASSQRVSFCSRTRDAGRPIARRRRPHEASWCQQVPTNRDAAFQVREKHWRTETGAGSCSGRASGRLCGG